MGKKLVLVLFLTLILCAKIFAHEENNAADYLYSEAYFDHLIECAHEEALMEKEQEKTQESVSETDEITIFDFGGEISDNFEPFKLRIEESTSADVYGETFKKPETKIIIPTSENFSFTYNTTQYINKNYTDGRRITSGIEYAPFRNLTFASGIETNYRDVDHNPLSRKIYFTPTYRLNDYLAVSFLNKYNFNNYSSDHDIGLYITPFKTKAIDFKAFAGMTNEHSGRQSQSASFYTNFYFF